VVQDVLPVHPTNSVKALKQTHSTGIILSSSTTRSGYC